MRSPASAFASCKRVIIAQLSCCTDNFGCIEAHAVRASRPTPFHLHSRSKDNEGSDHAHAPPTRACQRDPRAGDGRGREGASPAIRACRWAWRRSPRRCGTATCATTRPIRAGPTATASCCRTATARCCCTRCCTSRATTCRSTELKHFRQLHSKTPGHPEVGVTPGVETTTGPLGQGLANAVGMALAEELLAAQFNRPGHAIVDHHTYVFVGDGCLMEGISHEACSLAGTLELGQADRVLRRQRHLDRRPRRRLVHRRHAEALRGLRLARDAERRRARRRRRRRGDRGGEGRSPTRPTLICCKTVIGKGAPTKAGTEAVHGAALGEKEVAATRAALGWTHPPFEIPAARLLRRGTRASAARCWSRTGREVRGLSRRAPGGRRVHAPDGGRVAADFAARRRVRRRAGREGRDRRDAQGVAAGDRGLAPRLPELIGGRPISRARCSPTGRAA